MQTRRERLHAATSREILQTARRLLTTGGADAITLRAIARGMGTTAPALYRYFDNREDLLRHVVGGVYDEATAHLVAAAAAQPDLDRRILDIARAFRAWALENEREYALIFGTPIEGFDVYQDDATADAGRRFGAVFLDQFLELWRERRFPARGEDDMPRSLREQLERYRQSIDGELPPGALLTVVRCWERLQGSVSLEAFGHFRFVFEDPEPFFENMLSEVATLVGITYRPPGT